MDIATYRLNGPKSQFSRKFRIFSILAIKLRSFTEKYILWHNFCDTYLHFKKTKMTTTKITTAKMTTTKITTTR